jgi:Sec-independent protein translocase protein TatA
VDFLGIGPLELMFILLIILLVVGPRDIAKTGRSVGRLLNQVYRSESWKMLNEASRTLRTLPNRLAREASLEELDAVRKSVQETSDQISKEMKDVDEGLRAWTSTSTPPPPDDQSPGADGETIE